MAKSLDLVSSKAREQAEMRGHVLTTFTKHSKTVAFSGCMRCSASVTANMESNPEINGEAVTSTCTKKSEFNFY